METPNLGDILKHCTPEAAKLEDRQAWIEARSNGIGASESPILILGRLYGRTASDLWAEKVGVRDPENLDDEEHIKLGKAIEAIAGKLFEDEYGASCYRSEVQYRSKRWPFLTCTPDYWLVQEGDDEVSAIVEVKAPGMVEPWIEEGVALDTRQAHVWVQVQHQLAVTGLERAFAFAIGGSFHGLKMPWVPIDRDDAFIDAHLVPTCARFWEWVERDEQPDPDETAAWARVYKEVAKKKVAEQNLDPADHLSPAICSPEAAEATYQYDKDAALLKKIQARMQKAKNIALAEFEGRSRLLMPDGTSWVLTKDMRLQRRGE
jgi:putative phage-type endonuclease